MNSKTLQIEHKAVAVAGDDGRKGRESEKANHGNEQDWSGNRPRLGGLLQAHKIYNQFT